MEGGKGRAPKLLLNHQGPSEPCYATGVTLIYILTLLKSCKAKHSNCAVYISAATDP